MPILYADNRITVTYASGDAKGDSWGNPWTPEDIYQASVSGGWGVVEKLGETNPKFASYWIKKRLFMTGSNCFYDMSNTVVNIYNPDESRSYQVCNTTCNFKCHRGTEIFEIGDSDLGRGQRMYHYAYANTEVLLSQSAMLSAETWTLRSSGNGVCSVEDCVWSGIINHYHSLTTLNRVSIYGGSYGMIPQDEFVEANDVQVRDAGKAILCGYGSWTMTRFKAIGCTTDLQVMPNSSGRECILIDSLIDTDKTIFWNLGDNRDVKVWLKSTFNIIVSGTNLQLRVFDKDFNEVVNKTFTDNTSETVTYFYIEYATGVGGVGAVQIADDLQPFSVVISKLGYDSLFFEDIQVVPGQVTTIRGIINQTAIDPDASGLTNAYETESMRHLFLNEPILKIGDAGGLLPAVTAGSLYAALFTQDPGEAGSIANEATFGGYVRIPVPRGPTGWTEFLGKVRNLNQVNFPDCISGTEIITHYALMKELTGSEMVSRGELNDPVTVIPQYQLQFAPTRMEFNID